MSGDPRSSRSESTGGLLSLREAGTSRHPNQRKTRVKKLLSIKEKHPHAYRDVEKGGRRVSHEVTVYTTPTCSWCQAVKEYLRAREIDFEEIDVSTDQSLAEEMMDKSGQMGTPVLEIDGEIVIGFNRPEIDQLLDLV
ncbi:TPA: hypothetical protein DIT45_00045 [Candidatus Acetothermia bacterium]|nr:hypothetical protein [Candidatus Acetothermia bacterium]